MNIWEAVGLAYIILMTCCGTFGVLYFAWAGLKASVIRYHTGEVVEDSATRDYLALVETVRVEKR